jgi:hypothetical protein
MVGNDHALLATDLVHPADAPPRSRAYRELPMHHDRKESVMATAMMVDNPKGSQELYDKIRARLGLEKPAGGIFHVAGPSPNGGWRVIEVWESEDDARRFLEGRFFPALKALGVEAPPLKPQFWPVHNAMK